MTYQYPSPYPPRARGRRGHREPQPQDAARRELESREPPLVTSAGVPRLWNGYAWVPAPHLSADGQAWWNGVSWVPAPSLRYRAWGNIALGLAVFMAFYVVPMMLVGIGDSRIRADYAPGLEEALIPLVPATPAIAVAVISIVLDRKEKRRPILGLVSLVLAGLSVLLLWLAIFAGA